MNIVRIRKEIVNTKFTLIDIWELEKAQFTFTSSLSFPTDAQVVYGFELTIFNRKFQVNGSIEMVSESLEEYQYVAKIHPHTLKETEMLYEINQLAAAQSREYDRLNKSYVTGRYFDDVIVDYIC